MSIPRNSRGSAVHSRIDQSTGEILRRAAAEERSEERFSDERAPQPGGAAGSPPMGNTGVHASLVRATISPDYLTVVPHCGLDGVMPALRAVGLGALDKLEGGSRFSQEVYVGLHGLRVEALPRDEKLNYCVVTLPGACCQWLGCDGFRKLQEALSAVAADQECKVNITRIDLAADTQAFPARWVASALRGGAIDRKSESFDVHESDGDGCTVYLGAPTSDKRWRIYHKLDGSTFGDGVPFTRVEQQFRRDAAAAVYAMLYASEIDQWGAVAASLLNDYAQINKRWWRAFVGTVQTAALVLHRTRSTVERQTRWLRKQVAPTLALVVDAMSTLGALRGRIFLEELIADGRKRRSALGALRVATNEPDALPTLAIVGGLS